MKASTKLHWMRKHSIELTAFLCSSLLGAATVSCGSGSSTPDDEFGAEPNVFSRGGLTGSDMADKTLSLTFDDGPTAQTLPIASYLNSLGIQATFFMVGKNATGNSAIIRQVAAMGHLVANHSWSHSAMSTVGNPVAEVRDTDSLIAPHVVGNNFLFRAPYGDWRGNVADVLNATGMKKYVGPIFWNVGGELRGGYAADWACWGNGLSARACADGYLREIQDKRRGIVLMHDVEPGTTAMVKILVPQLISQGYTFKRTDLVPGIAAQLRAVGATPGSGTASPQPPVQDLSEYFCLNNGTVERVGTGGAILCKSGIEAIGPFTEGMKAQCVAAGGGSSCTKINWDWNFTLAIHGNGKCPRGANEDPQTGFCVEGINAFGPFPKKFVERCLANGGGEGTCRSGRWNVNFLRNIAASL